MRHGTRTLTSHEIPVRRRDAALARRHHVAVGSHAHRTARLAPLPAGGLEYMMQSFLLRPLFHLQRSRHHPGRNAVRAEIGRASSRESVCPAVYTTAVSVPIKKKK